MSSKIPPGYKETEIGIIPEDWEVKRLGDVFNVETGTTPSTQKIENWKNGIIIVSDITNLTNIQEPLNPLFCKANPLC